MELFLDHAIIIFSILVILKIVEIVIEVSLNKIKFIGLKDDTIIPTKDRGNAGYDIYANFDEENFVIQPHETRLVPTALSTIFLPRYVMLLRERGSTGSRGMALRAGVVDSNYRGEIFVGITNTNDKPLVITKEKDTSALEDDYIVYPYTKAIAQAIFVELSHLTPVKGKAKDLEKHKTNRGKGALGSSGK